MGEGLGGGLGVAGVWFGGDWLRVGLRGFGGVWGGLWGGGLGGWGPLGGFGGGFVGVWGVWGGFGGGLGGFGGFGCVLVGLGFVGVRQGLTFPHRNPPLSASTNSWQPVAGH